MHYFNFKNRLALISLAVLASSSSLLAMEAIPMDIDDSPAMRTRSKSSSSVVNTGRKRPAPYTPDDLRNQAVFVAMVIAEIAPGEVVLAQQVLPEMLALENSPHKKRKIDHLLSAKENYAPLTVGMGGNIQAEETFTLQVALQKARGRIEHLEHSLAMHQREAEKTKENFQASTQSLESIGEIHVANIKDLRRQLEDTKATHKTEIKELEKTKTADQAKIKELEKQLQNTESAHRIEIQKFENRLKNATTKDQTKIQESENHLKSAMATCQALQKQLSEEQEQHQHAQYLLQTVQLNYQALKTKNLALEKQIQRIEEEKKQLTASLHQPQQLMTVHQQLQRQHQQLQEVLQENNLKYQESITKWKNYSSKIKAQAEQKITNKTTQLRQENIRLKEENQSLKDKLQKKQPSRMASSLPNTSVSCYTFTSQSWGSGMDYASAAPTPGTAYTPSTQGCIFIPNDGNAMTTYPPSYIPRNETPKTNSKTYDLSSRGFSDFIEYSDHPY